jgi:hypothetical protein
MIDTLVGVDFAVRLEPKRERREFSLKKKSSEGTDQIEKTHWVRKAVIFIQYLCVSLLFT